MYRAAVWGLSALTAGVCATCANAADPVKPADKPGLATRMFGSSDKKPDPQKTFAEVAPRPPVVIGPLDPVVLAEALRAEQDAWQRRMDVCLKLRMLADKLNDEKLLQQADDLEKHATALYHQRCARFGVKAHSRSAADTLDRTLGSGAAVTPLTIPAPVPAAEPSTGQPRQFREVKP